MLCIDCHEREGRTPGSKRCNRCQTKNYYKTHPGYRIDHKNGGNYIKVLERDDYKCTKCGSTKRVFVIHLDDKGSAARASERNDSLDNLASVCNKCIRVESGKKNRLNPGEWSKKYSHCVVCSGKTRPHGGKGKCSRCYIAERFKLGLIKKIIREPGYFKSWPSYQAKLTGNKIGRPKNYK